LVSGFAQINTANPVLFDNLQNRYYQNVARAFRVLCALAVIRSTTEKSQMRDARVQEGGTAWVEFAFCWLMITI